MRKDLENWLRGETMQDAETVTQTKTMIDVIELQLPVILSSAEPEEPQEAVAGEVPDDAFNETSDGETSQEIPGAMTEEDMEKTEIAAENYQDGGLETEKMTAAQDDESDEDYHRDDENLPASELLEESGSRLSMRMRHIKDMKRTSNIHERGGFRKDRVRFFTLCVCAIIVIGTGIALYRSMQSNSYEALMEKARGLYEQEQYSAAFEVYGETSRGYPDRVEPFLGTAHAAERTGRVDDAIEAYRSCLERFPTDAAHARSNVFYEIGRLHATLKTWEKAQESFEEAIAADAANYGAYFSLGDSLEEQDQPDKALLAYKQAVELSPSSDAAREAVRRVSLIISSREEMEKDALVERQYEQAVSAGGVALEEARYDEASKYFAEALAIRSDDVNAWVGFGEARFSLGDTAGAVKSMERALERDPEHERAKLKLAEIESQTKEPQTKESQTKEPQTKKNTRPRQSNPSSSPRSSTRKDVIAPAAETLARSVLFDAGVGQYLEGEYEASFNSFIACLRSTERGLLPSVSLAGDPGPVWKGAQIRLNIPSDARLLAETVRLNPADRELYVNIVMAGTKMGLDKQSMRSALNEAHSHALATANNL